METFLFTSKSVNEKLCDQISDAVLDACFAQDPDSKVACETCTKTNTLALTALSCCSSSVSLKWLKVFSDYTPKEKSEPKHRKGLWSPEEDERLRNYIIKYGHGCWSSVALRSGLQRNGKRCRLRWTNYLRPGLKRAMFSLPFSFFTIR